MMGMGLDYVEDPGSYPEKLRCWLTLGHDLEEERQHRIGYAITTIECQHCGKRRKRLTRLPVPPV